MKAKLKSNGFPVCSALLLFLLCGILNTFSFLISSGSSFPFLFESTVYSVIIVLWIVYINRYILSEKTRELLNFLGGLLLFYIFLRALKYNYWHGYDNILRNIWYLYYVPQIFIPFITLAVSVRIGKAESYKFPAVFSVLLIFAVLLSFGIITNDFHMLAFRFNDNFIGWETEYTRGPFYYIAAIWIYLMLFISLYILTGKFKAADKKTAWLPLFWLATGSIYILIITAVPGINDFKPFNLPETECFIIIAMIESSIKTGLIPSNKNYAEYFRNSSTPVIIADRNKNIIYKSADSVNISSEDMKRADSSPLLITEDLILNSKEISGGNIYWIHDISNINRMNGELYEIGDRLREKSEILKKENDVKTEKAKIEEENRLYDNISELLEPQLDKVQKLLCTEKSFCENAELLCIIGCYIKRRANLALLSEGRSDIDIEELYLSIKETNTYIRLKDTVCSVLLNGRGNAPSAFILDAFDYWGNFTENSCGILKAVLVNIIWNDRDFFLRLSYEAERKIYISPEINYKLYNHGAEITETEEDGTYFTDIKFSKEEIL